MASKWKFRIGNGSTSPVVIGLLVILIFAVVALAWVIYDKKTESSGTTTSESNSGSGSILSHSAEYTNIKASYAKDDGITLDIGDNVTMKLVLIPAGKFMMGRSENEKDSMKTEGPQHEVTITKPYYMGVYEVTQEQYEQITGENPSNFKGAQNPVEQVSWTDAVEFCKAVSKKTGKMVRLPTEAEWEYACRAGSKTRFSFGDNDEVLGEYAWWGSKKNNSNKHTRLVGKKKNNDWGLYDMHGNVWEWCADWYDENYYSATGIDRDPQGPSFGTDRVARGGSYSYDPAYCRSAHRNALDPDKQGISIGFRVVVDVK